MKNLLTALAALVLAAPALAAPRRTTTARTRNPPDVSLDRSRHHRRGNPRAARPAGVALRPDRRHSLVRHRRSSGQDDRRNGPSRGPAGPRCPDLQAEPLEYRGGVVRLGAGRWKVVTSVGTFRRRLPDPGRASSRRGQRRVRPSRRPRPPPDNDERGEAEEISRLPATVRGSTLGATSDYGGTAALPAARSGTRSRAASGRLLVQLSTGDRDGVVAGSGGPRNDLYTVGCAATNRDRKAVLGFATKADVEYLIVVGDKSGSGPGDFTLTVRPGALPGDCPGGRCRNEARTHTCTGSPTSTTSGRCACDAGRCTGSPSTRSLVRTRPSGGGT